LKTALIPHTLRLLAVATTLTLAAGCGGSDSTANSTATTDAAGAATTAAGTADTADTAAPSTDATGPAPTADALTVESGFSTGLSSLGTRFTSVGAVVTNTSDRTACGVQVEFTILDAKGTALETQTRTVHVAAPKAAVPVVPNAMGGGKPDEPTKLDVKVVGVDSFATGDTCDVAAASSVTLATTGVTVDADLKYIRGTVSNPTAAPTGSTAMDCVLRAADGTIAGGDKKTIVDPIAPGAEVAFKLRLLWAPPTATAADCNATA
jgi:hypothetical protein